MCGVLGTANEHPEVLRWSLSGLYANSGHHTENCPTGPQLGVSSENGVWAIQRLYSGVETPLSMNPCPFLWNL